MPAFPVPAALKLFSGGLAFGGLWTPPEDYVAPNLGLGIRLGLLLPEAPFEAELNLYDARGTLRDDPVDLRFGLTRADLLFKLVDGARLHVVAGPGLGWRHVSLSTQPADLDTARGTYGVDTSPTVDLVLAAGGGVRAWIVGPVHLRADVQGLLQIGEQPTSEPAHAWPGVLASVGLDLRYEPPPDHDRDGVPDKKDRCPDTPEDWDYFEDDDGCPDLDDDKDGVPDAVDTCKDEPEDLDGFEDEDGCPDANNDEDAFPDIHDRCPDQAETANGWEDGDGCPDTVPPDVAAVIGTRTDVRFGPDGLTPEAVAALEVLAGVFERYPAMRMRISVFTNDTDGAVGAHERTRAQAVLLRDWLVAHGVAPTRLRMTAGGAGIPVGADRGDAEKESNRRVVLGLLDEVDGDGTRLEFDLPPPERW
jgi:outer membrane protein OmpA-like peptidoglycan-associated protein